MSMRSKERRQSTAIGQSTASRPPSSYGRRPIEGRRHSIDAIVASTALIADTGNGGDRGRTPVLGIGIDAMLAKRAKAAGEVERRNISTEFNFNRETKGEHDQLRRIKSEVERRRAAATPGERHHGDENIADGQLLGASMPERMMHLSIRSRSPNIGDTSYQHNVSPSTDRAKDRSPTGSTARVEISNAKLAMMKKRLEPLPNRNRLKSSNDELSDA